MKTTFERTDCLEGFTGSELLQYSLRINKLYIKRFAGLLFVMMFCSCSPMAFYKMPHEHYQKMPKTWSGNFEPKVTLRDTLSQTCELWEREHYLNRILTLTAGDSITKMELVRNTLFVTYTTDDKKSVCKVIQGKRKAYYFVFDTHYETWLAPPFVDYISRERVYLAFPKNNNLEIILRGCNFGNLLIFSAGTDSDDEHIQFKPL